MTRIVVAGSINIDYVLRTPTLPGAGETISGSDFLVVGGGKGANQAVACARLGADTALLGFVGSDAAGRDCLIRLAAENLDKDSLMTAKDKTTGSALIFVAENGENCIGISAGANTMLDASVIESKAPLISQADFLLLQLETPLDGIVAAAKLAKQQGTQVILNPAPAQSLPDDLLANVDILTPNQTEAAELSGMPCMTRDEAAAASNWLIDNGPTTVIITLGEQGALVNDGDTITMVNAPTVDVIDTVAAGDTFNGALAVALSEGQPLIEAARFATRAASLAVTKAGAQPAIPYRRDLRS
ncbi:MAG: ribokinase [Woeseiaceae bacterium]